MTEMSKLGVKLLKLMMFSKRMTETSLRPRERYILVICCFAKFAKIAEIWSIAIFMRASFEYRCKLEKREKSPLLRGGF